MDEETAQHFLAYPEKAQKAAWALCTAAACFELVGCSDAARDFVRRAVEVLELGSDRKDTWAAA